MAWYSSRELPRGVFISSYSKYFVGLSFCHISQTGRVFKFVTENVFNKALFYSTMNVTKTVTTNDKGCNQIRWKSLLKSMKLTMNPINNDKKFLKDFFVGVIIDLDVFNNFFKNLCCCLLDSLLNINIQPLLNRLQDQWPPTPWCGVRVTLHCMDRTCT